MATFNSKQILSLALAAVGSAAMAAPSYVIFDDGPATPTTVAQGWGVSPNGTYSAGWTSASIGTGLVWTKSAGYMALPLLTGKTSAKAYCADSNGNLYGIAGTKGFAGLNSGTPVMWTLSGGSYTAAALPFPLGYSAAVVNYVNASGLGAGWVVPGSVNKGALWDTVGMTAQVIPNTTQLNGINDAGIACGYGPDSNDAARYACLIYDTNAQVLTDIGGPGNPSNPGNGGIANAISQDSSGNAIVVGAGGNYTNNIGFLWTQAGGMVTIPLPAAFGGSGSLNPKAVNTNGWVVGNGSTAFAIPFLYDGTTCYRIGDLITNPGNWSLVTGTSNSATGVSNNGVITGTAMHGSNIRMYTAIPVGQASGQIIFNDFTGAATPSSCKIDFEDASNNIVGSETAALDGSGNFSGVGAPALATLYVSTEIRPWLRRTVGMYDMTMNQSGIVLSLTNGDCDGNNSIDIGDYLELAAAYGSFQGDSNYDRYADLNGDLQVDIGDYLILAANYGSFGDN